MTSALAARLQAIDVLILDVHGVLTDGNILYSDAGHELQGYHVRDGSGLALWRRAGKRAAAITGRGSKALERRAKELHLDPLMMQAHDKAEAIATLLPQLGVGKERIAAVGDDLPDQPVFRSVGVTFAVGDACSEIKAMADYVVEPAGGRGAVRAVIEVILKAQGRWEQMVQSY